MKSTDCPTEYTMTNKKLFIGLDVHKNSIVVATAAEGETDAKHYGKWGGSLLSAERGLNKLLRSFSLTKDQVKICYEPNGVR